MHRITITATSANRNREAWLAIRRQHLTATDWPKITGTSRWGDAFSVLDDKLNPGGDEDFKPSLPMRVGTALEPLIIRSIQKDWGPGKYLSQVFVSRKHLGFTPDLVLLATPDQWRLAEIKVSVKPWLGWVPPDYLDQVSFQATVLGIGQVQVIHLQLESWGEGLALIRSGTLPADRLTAYNVEVDEVDRRRIERKAEKWWKAHINEDL